MMVTERGECRDDFARTGGASSVTAPKEAGDSGCLVFFIIYAIFEVEPHSLSSFFDFISVLKK